jgi:hypothetical protein
MFIFVIVDGEAYLMSPTVDNKEIADLIFSMKTHAFLCTESEEFDILSLPEDVDFDLLEVCSMFFSPYDFN